jgi:protein SCO1/2
VTGNRRLLNYGALGFLALLVTLAIGWWQVDGRYLSADREGQSRPSITEMDFSLVDHEGTEVGADTLVGRPALVFFGFTYCPDVCPTTLSDISVWLDDLANESDGMNVVFITVDPERDTAKAMASYVSNFHPAIRGWTGSPEQIAAAASDFGVSYQKIGIVGDEYTMDHTASVFMFSSNGELASTIDYHEKSEFAVPKIRRALN